MGINKGLINIYKGVYAEYGPKVTVERLSNILKLSIGSMNPAKVEFTDCSIHIIDSNPVDIYFEDEYYQVVRKYKNYMVSHSYDGDGNIFNKTTFFDTKDGNMIALDYIDSQTLGSMRLIKTTKDDIELMHPLYERERMELTEYPVTETSRYTEFTNGDVDDRRLLDLDGEFVYAHYTCEDDTFQETAACLSMPHYLILGRSRRPNDLLKNSEQIKMPNIQMRGHDEEGTYYDVSIDKHPRFINICVTTYNTTFGTKEEQNYQLPIQSRRELTTGELRMIIHALSETEYAFKGDIIRELEEIREQVRIFVKDELRDIDAIELQMDLHPEYNEFAFFIYENLDAFDEAIDASMDRGPAKEASKILS